MIHREVYLNDLMKYKDNNKIKLIRGMRQSGKTVIVKEFVKELETDKNNNIIYIECNTDCDLLKLKNNLEDSKLPNLINRKIKIDKNNYIFFDEIQDLFNWKYILPELLSKINENKNITIDLYFIGINFKRLKNFFKLEYNHFEYNEINVLPLSFREFLELKHDFNKVHLDKASKEERDEILIQILNKKTEFEIDKNKDYSKEFKEYVKYGSLPLLFEYNNKKNILKNLVFGVYNTIFLQDMIKRNSIKNVLLLERIIKYTLLNLGNVTSSKNLCKYLKKDCKKTTPTTVLDYLKILEDSYLFYSVSRYDIAKDKELKTLPKYYIGDIGINNAIMGFNEDIANNILENIVFLELLHRDCEIRIGKYNNKEISFVVKTNETRKYYQICKCVNDKDALNEKCESLELIKDNYEKIIITLEKNLKKELKGIKLVNIIDFLLEDC
ncbi:ATP-binding protein [uncultured Methanobrevibacter sp.]|uniref:ATP-binding protein n=1 Tax=uncultured Methanobrevibacter sp. TaxID=253161 RepID=UPI0025E515CF|nr:ATP-binding protein [uncultured Methanobrevibacter sp.]